MEHFVIHQTVMTLSCASKQKEIFESDYPTIQTQCNFINTLQKLKISHVFSFQKLYTMR